MGNLIVFTNLTLDGVMQAPGRPDEDLRDGFPYGGWATPYAAMQSSAVTESLPGMDALLLGRRTYEDFYAYWPKQTNNPFTEALNQMPKYVASTTLTEPLAWRNSTLLKGDVPKAVAQLKQQTDKNLVLMGSGELIQTLMQHNLVDRSTQNNFSNTYKPKPVARSRSSKSGSMDCYATGSFHRDGSGLYWTALSYRIAGE